MLGRKTGMMKGLFLVSGFWILDAGYWIGKVLSINLIWAGSYFRSLRLFARTLSVDEFVKSYNMPLCDTVTENNFCKSGIKVYLLSEASDNKGR